MCVLCFGCHVLDWIHQRLRQKTRRSWFLIHYAHIDVVMMMGFLPPLCCSSPTSIIIIICRAQLDFHSFINPPLPTRTFHPSVRPSVRLRDSSALNITILPSSKMSWGKWWNCKCVCGGATKKEKNWKKEKNYAQKTLVPYSWWNWFAPESNLHTILKLLYIVYSLYSRIVCVENIWTTCAVDVIILFLQDVYITFGVDGEWKKRGDGKSNQMSYCHHHFLQLAIVLCCKWVMSWAQNRRAAAVVGGKWCWRQEDGRGYHYYTGSW